jgi:hypothetical protein
MGGEEDLTGFLRGHQAIAQDEVREDGEHRAARRALKPPDEDATKTDTEVMGMTRQASSTATGCRVLQLEAYGEEEGTHELEKCLAIVKQANVGGFILEINGDGAVVPRLCGCCAQGVTPRSSGLIS